MECGLVWATGLHVSYSVGCCSTEIASQHLLDEKALHQLMHSKLEAMAQTFLGVILYWRLAIFGLQMS